MNAVVELMDAIPTLFVRTHPGAGAAHVTMGGTHIHLMHVYQYAKTLMSA